MVGTNFNRLASITAGGSPILAPENWKPVGTGFFDSVNTTNRLGILWQNQTDGVLAVWYLREGAIQGERTEWDATIFFDDHPAAGWKALAVGNFDGDQNQKSDIAFQHEVTGEGMIWVMNGTAKEYGQTIQGTAGQPNWRITGAGDFGKAGTPPNQYPPSPGKDGKTDLFLTYYNPATDNMGINLAGIWYMNGATLELATAVRDSSDTFNVTVDNPDWRGVASGNFDQNPEDWTDVVFRFVTIGRTSLWPMSGHKLIGGGYLKPEPDPTWKLYSQDWFQSTWRHKDLYPSISATPSSGSITLNFRIKPHGANGVTIRRRQAGQSWNGSEIAIGVTTDSQGGGSYTDNIAPNPGTRYEYEVAREGTPPAENYPGRVLTGLSVQPDRGKVLVIVDSTVAPSISSSLNTFTSDLIADGWTVVVKNDAPPHIHGSENCSGGNYNLKSGSAADTANQNNRVALKQWIRANTNDAKGIVLVGHVTVPLSGTGIRTVTQTISGLGSQTCGTATWDQSLPGRMG